MQRFLITFDSSVSKEERAKVMRRLEELDVMYSVASDNTHFDAIRGMIPKADRIIVLWDSFGNFTTSSIYTDLPNGCTVSRV